MKKSIIILSFFLVNINSFAQTTITSPITIDQVWINNNSTGPWTIGGNNVTVTFGENLTISSPTQYFEILGTNVTIDGAGKTVTISGVTNYLGLVVASSNASSSALIKNIGVHNNNSNLYDSRGGYISAESNKATIRNCFSTGPISDNGTGGIAGPFNEGNISDCYSTGVISGDYSGGITVYTVFGNISNCYSSGEISGMESGGIVGYESLSNIQNCYTSGEISGKFAGGIVSVNSSSIVDCRTSGSITGTYADGIGFNSPVIGMYSGIGTTRNAFNVTSSPINSWDNDIADIVLTDLGTVWNTSVSPYTLLSFGTVPTGTVPTFSNPGPITMCELGTYYLAPSTTDGSWTSSTPTVATVNSNGYVTALSQGTTVVSLITTGGTVTATVTVSSTSTLPAITDGQASYKFDGTPKGPSSASYYIGYNGFNYSSPTRPTKPGFYKANNQAGSEAGCPYTFYIYRCTTCSDVPALPPVAPTPRP